ncbi:MAG: Stp1/IreP family PP2C-type Ser/Thr phosphatase [Clostridia bacterium]|nr:Stp1/IreP family PP2C-type Ser/Thr phosphatase [Clostridia bacterium]
MISAARTHIGNVRASNQDALLVLPGVYGVYGVADGMGGHKAGDVASKMAVSVVERLLRNQAPSPKLLQSAIEEANALIYEEQLNNPDYSGMGTTMTLIWEDDDRVLLGHVGDSRAYRVRKKSISQVSRDHSMVAEMVRKGLITEEEARVHPYRNIITRALGTAETIEVDVEELDKQPGDLYLLCSDGLSEYIRDEEMLYLLRKHPSLEEAADVLLNLALEGGGRDNISVVLAEVAP